MFRPLFPGLISVRTPPQEDRSWLESTTCPPVYFFLLSFLRAGHVGRTCSGGAFGIGFSSFYCSGQSHSVWISSPRLSWRAGQQQRRPRQRRVHISSGAPAAVHNTTTSERGRSILLLIHLISQLCTSFSIDFFLLGKEKKGGHCSGQLFFFLLFFFFTLSPWLWNESCAFLLFFSCQHSTNPPIRFGYWIQLASLQLPFFYSSSSTGWAASFLFFFIQSHSFLHVFLNLFFFKERDRRINKTFIYHNIYNNNNGVYIYLYI